MILHKLIIVSIFKTKSFQFLMLLSRKMGFLGGLSGTSTLYPRCRSSCTASQALP